MRLERRTWRVLVALVFGHRERAILLEALGVRGAVDWREAATLDGLVEHAHLVDGGVELLASILRAELPDAEAWRSGSPAALAASWDPPRRTNGRSAAALLLAVAASPGALMRRLEARMLDDLEARALDGLRRTRRASIAAHRNGAVIHP